MKHRIYFPLTILVFLIAATISITATDAIVKQHATLRKDPSSKHKPLMSLVAGEDVELIESAPTHSYYHVRTTDGEEGWVYSRNLEIISTAPTAPAATPPLQTPMGPGPGIGSSISPNWEKPVPSPNTFQGPDGNLP